jgi:tetratricopeptide (TPR) repeat protein
MKMMRWVGTIFLFFLLISCQSVQKDLLVSGMDESARVNLADLEENIVRLESAPAANALAENRKKITALEKETQQEPNFLAHLAAWSGRLYLLEGKTTEAQRELRKSQTISSGNLSALILLVRLEGDRQKRLALLDEHSESRELGEIQIERGRVLLELNRFTEAVAAFDLAFTLLDDRPFYREAFQVSRDRAWELRDITAGNATVQIAQQDGISWKDLIEITKAETDLLRFLTAGRNWTAEEIFARLLERAFIPQTQDITLDEWKGPPVLSTEIVLRSGTAWFLWHLYAENRANRGLLSRYSSRYANRPNAESPIPDLPLRSPFFDSILGCVESEFMSLPDGVNFNPREKIRGSSYLAMLKKLNP